MSGRSVASGSRRHPGAGPGAPIGLLGGAFDPVHNGHLRLALEVLERLALAEVRLVPLAAAAHREQPAAPAHLRRAMLEAAIAGEPRLRVDPRELERAGVSYTVDTLASVRAELGARPLVWILGMDSFASLPRWHRWTELMGLANFAVAQRPGTPLPADGALRALLAAHGTGDTAALLARPAGAIVLVDLPLLDVSATAVRELLASGRSVRALVPDAVRHIIEYTGLYHAEL
ncbi:MAG: nicotinate-nucleotide adenylyltransferase [Gammaproteobacteria bacterium]|nr:nicotinate-nucleotide adenylyltransferase [Gammaproteobacteria bacterium]